MSNQPEALFLAEVIESDPQSKAHHDAAAACLRRLHAEIESLKAERDAFLDALRDMYASWQYIRSFHCDLYEVGLGRCDSKARAVIAKAERQDEQP